MTFVRNIHGPAVYSERPRRCPLPTPAQVLRRRNEDWRLDYERGRYNPETRTVERRSVALIALLAGVPERTVRHGIAEARRLRDAIHADECDREPALAPA